MTPVFVRVTGPLADVFEVSPEEEVIALTTLTDFAVDRSYEIVVAPVVIVRTLFLFEFKDSYVILLSKKKLGATSPGLKDKSLT